MGNAVDEALNRMNADERAYAIQTIEDARRTIQTAELQKGYSPTSDITAIVSRNEQIIEEAKRAIPVETMKSVDEISPPLNTPPTHGISNSNVIELHPDMHSDIESVQQSGGNNYLNENAVDRALARPAQDGQQYDQQERAVGR
ncbi:hypothetical protein [Mucilaginibacter sp.]